MSQKWKQVIDFSNMSLNSALDGADIDDNECQQALDVIFDNKALEKAPGRTVLGTYASSGYPVDGVHRSWNKAGDKSLLKVVNGVLYRWNGSTWVSVQGGLTAAVRYDFLNTKDKTLIVNGYDEALEFDPSNNSIRKLGLEPPRFYKKIAYFEDDEEAQWTLGTGAYFDNTIYGITERTGDSKQSLFVNAPAATNRTSTLIYSTVQDFSQFSNGISISADALSCVSILHRARSYVDHIDFKFLCGASPYTSYYLLTIDGSELDPDNGRDNVWTNIQKSKSDFVATGSPTWNAIVGLQVILYGQTGTAEINVDNCYWKNPPITANVYKKQIENFEGLISNWSVTNGSVADDTDEVDRTEGSKSILVTPSSSPVTVSRTVSLDLSKYADNASVLDSDEIAIDVQVPPSSYLISIALNLYTTVGDYYSYVFTVASGEIKISPVSNLWNNLRKSVDLFSETGSPSWANITKIEFVISYTVGLGTLNFDNWIVEPKSLSLQLATMESSEAWVFVGTGAFNYSYISEGVSSISLSPSSEGSSWATLILTSPVDLSQFTGGEASIEDDFISFWLYYNSSNTLHSVRLEIDCNLGDFTTDLYTYEWSSAVLNSLVGSSYGQTRVQAAKADFTRIGTSPGKGWATVKGYRFVTTRESPYQCYSYFDDLRMVRRKGLNGIYQWACVFRRPDGSVSAVSEWSDQVTLSEEKAILTLLPISGDADVKIRDFYRKGGNIGSSGRLDFTLYDNTTVLHYTDTPDEALGEVFDVTVIPTGTIRVPLAAKFGPKFKGEYILYRDLANLARVYHSLAGIPYGWSELQAYDFDTDVLDVFVIDNILFFNTKAGVRSLSIPMSEATPADFHERGITKHSMGPFTSYPVEGQRAVVSYDGVYIFNGNSFRYISERMQDYFDPVNYTISEAIVFYRKRHLYISVVSTAGVRTLLDCYLPTGNWRISSYVVNCFCVAEGILDNDEIYIGDLFGNVYQFDTGYASSSEIVTKDYPADSVNKFAEAVVQEIFVMARSLSSTPGVINIQFRMNQLLNAGIVKSFPSTGNLTSTYKLYHAQLQGVNNYLKGNKIGLAITPGTLAKHFQIQSILLVGEITPLPETYEEDTIVGADLITFLGRLSSDPSTTDWTTADAGRYLWFNVTDFHWKGWNGTEIVLIG